LIAQQPVEPRDASRLMVVRRDTGEIEHRIFRDLAEYLNAGDALVVNRTRVLPAKFLARRATGGRVEGLFIREIEIGIWEVMLGGLRRLKTGEVLQVDPRGRGSAGSGVEAVRMELVRRLERGRCEVRVHPADPAPQILDLVGTMPLPPYISRESQNDVRDTVDRERYQTVFAAEPGAIAAPTAGLHFTPELLDRVRGLGIDTVEVVLHVGLGTFQPVEAEHLADHGMHAEWFEFTGDAAVRIRERRSRGGRIVAVGTTSVRVLETVGAENELSAATGWTDILIYPPFRFRWIDALITNFHLPGSTLLALVGAFAGMDLIHRAYRTAVEERYRFYSYGDAMLIL